MNFHDFHIQPKDKVLDIGCGAMPFVLATHLADISLSNNSARFGQPIPVRNRPFFECSVEAMPFEDHFFDFVYCAHVLEHVENPAKACQEIMRVGQRGYIECPRSWVEYIFQSEDHRWLVDHEKDCLIFREKLEEERKDILGLQYRIFDWLKYPGFRRHWSASHVKSIRNVEFYWEKKFNYVVIPKAQRMAAGNRLGGKKVRINEERPQKSLQELRCFLNTEFERHLALSAGFENDQN